MSEDNKRSLDDVGMYVLMDKFSPSTISPIIKFILEKNLITGQDRPKHLTLVINSPGGDLTSCFALIDTMKASAIPVRTVGIGQISSCGIVTFMAGQKGHRVLTPNTSILSHQWAWGSGGKEHELFAALREFDLTAQRMMAHYKKCTSLNEKMIREVLLPPQDVWLSAQEAVKYGIADRIVTTY